MASSNMESLRLKVEYNEETLQAGRQKIETCIRFIHCLEVPYKKYIGDLMQELQDRINQELSTRNRRIVQVNTSDGYALKKSDHCSIALKDNDSLICIDMKGLICDTNSTIDFDRAWLLMKEHDVSDNYEKYIHIGLSYDRKLYIRFRGELNNYGILLYDIRELIEIATQKRQKNLIARLDGTDNYDETSNSDWFIQCKWEYNPNSHAELFIICELKLGAEENVMSKKLQILLDHAHLRIKKGEITDLTSGSIGSTKLTDAQRQRLKQLAASIPPPKRSGPRIDINAQKDLKITKHECEGESSIRMANGNTNTVEIYQDRRSNQSSFFQQDFIITHIIFSKKSSVLPEILNQKRSQQAEKAVSVASVTVFYQTHDGGWKECEEVTIAPVPVRNEEPRWLTDSVINIQPDKLVSYSIRGTLAVKGETGVDNAARARVHKSLPQPFKLKIVITDSTDKKSSLIVEKINPPLNIITLESYLNDYGSDVKELLGFIYADDCEQDERHYLMAYVNSQNELYIKSAGSYAGIYDRKGLRTLQYHLKQKQTPEHEFEDLAYQRDGNELKVIGLFDPEAYILYGIRGEISTKTSKTTETIFIPIDKIE